LLRAVEDQSEIQVYRKQAVGNQHIVHDQRVGIPVRNRHWHATGRHVVQGECKGLVAVVDQAAARGQLPLIAESVTLRIGYSLVTDRGCAERQRDQRAQLLAVHCLQSSKPSKKI
jgi:hypothetical protein